MCLRSRRSRAEVISLFPFASPSYPCIYLSLACSSPPLFAFSTSGLAARYSRRRGTEMTLTSTKRHVCAIGLPNSRVSCGSSEVRTSFAYIGVQCIELSYSSICHGRPSLSFARKRLAIALTTALCLVEFTPGSTRVIRLVLARNVIPAHTYTSSSINISVSQSIALSIHLSNYPSNYPSPTHHAYGRRCLPFFAV